MFKNNPMVKSLLSLRGNPRACVYTEPLWGIPHSLYMPFVSLYMAALLLSDEQIGLVASVALLFRALSASVSGVLTDKLGRKLATVIFDIISWSIPCLLWTFSQNFWWFMFAAALNGLWQITENSWHCLLVEDAQKSQMVYIYSWVQVANQLAVIFGPLSAILVKQVSIIPAMRILYLFSFVSMTAKFLILYKYCDETKVGKTRLEQTKGKSFFSIFAGYKELVPRILGSAHMRLALAINILFTISRMVMENFFGLYTSLTLLVPEQNLAYFPIIRSAIVLLFLFVIQSRVARFGFRAPMLVGIVFYLLSHAALVFSPTGSFLGPVVYTILEALAHGFVIPRKDSVIALFVDPDERARINSFNTMIVLGISIPFGYIAGLLSGMDRRLPFVLNGLIFLTAFVVIALSKSLSAKATEAAANN